MILQNNPHFLALRSVPMALSGASRRKQIPSSLDYWRAKLTRQRITPWLIHGGTTLQHREKATVLPWNDLSPLIEKIA